MDKGEKEMKEEINKIKKKKTKQFSRSQQN